jgi:hypothetical protein
MITAAALLDLEFEVASEEMSDLVTHVYSAVGLGATYLFEFQRHVEQTTGILPSAGMIATALQALEQSGRVARRWDHELAGFGLGRWEYVPRMERIYMELKL